MLRGKVKTISVLLFDRNLGGPVGISCDVVECRGQGEVMENVA